MKNSIKESKSNLNVAEVVTKKLTRKEEETIWLANIIQGGKDRKKQRKLMLEKCEAQLKIKWLLEKIESITILLEKENELLFTK
jgi:uncharacterized Fe-S cluster-containing protein